MHSDNSQTLDHQLPLTGLCVIEMDAIGPVPFVGYQLRLLGADVVRVRPPADRAIGLELDTTVDLLNHGKSVERLDLKTQGGCDQLWQLLAGADVLLDGFRPGVLEKLGFAPEQLLQRCPQLVIGRLPGWGTRGPLAQRAGHDINYLALSGLLSTVGTADRPVIPGNLIADFGGGAMHLISGVLAALVRRGINGQGGLVQTSLLAGSVGLSPMLHELFANGHWSEERETNILDGGAPFYRVYKTRDQQFVAVGALEGKFFEALLQLLSLSDDIDATRQWDTETWLQMAIAIAAKIAQVDRDDWAHRAQTTDACLTPVLSPSEALAHSQLIDNNLVTDTPVKGPGSPWTIQALQSA